MHHRLTLTTNFSRRAHWFVLGILVIIGAALSWNAGDLPQRQPSSNAAPKANDLAPDLALYRDVIAELRDGANYYTVAAEKIPQYGFPISSPLNWRLPTYAWLLSRLPPAFIQPMLVALSILALALAFKARLRSSGIGYAALTTFLLFGVVRWAIDGQAYLAQEPWAATLIIISLSAHALGGRGGRGRESFAETNITMMDDSQPQKTPDLFPVRAVGWRTLAIAAGTAALFFRELALPYCGIALLIAAWNRRWSEAVAWSLSVAAFMAFYAWHIDQVHAQLTAAGASSSSSLGQWLRFGGLDYVLLTTRMNSLLFHAPGGLLWLYLLAALIGLSRQPSETNQLACLAALAYLLAFAFLGRPENFYWGLLPAPLLAWGAAQAPVALLTSVGMRSPRQLQPACSP